jgi:hypothetical protein
MILSLGKHCMRADLGAAFAVDTPIRRIVQAGFSIAVEH